jgi:RHS repeat-associated protein
LYNGSNLFGEQAPSVGPSFPFKLRFRGHYYEQESGLFYNYFRYYEPSTGRYLESDPVGLKGGFSTYDYVNVNPLRFADPFGLFCSTFTSVISPRLPFGPPQLKNRGPWQFSFAHVEDPEEKLNEAEAEGRISPVAVAVLKLVNASTKSLECTFKRSLFFDQKYEKKYWHMKTCVGECERPISFSSWVDSEFKTEQYTEADLGNTGRIISAATVDEEQACEDGARPPEP